KTCRLFQGEFSERYPKYGSGHTTMQWRTAEGAAAETANWFEEGSSGCVDPNPMKVRIGCGRLGAAEVNRPLFARHDSMDGRILPVRRDRELRCARKPTNIGPPLLQRSRRPLLG